MERVIRVLLSTATLVAILLVTLIIVRLAILAPRLALAVVAFIVFIAITMALSSIFKWLRLAARRRALHST